jgi:ABC-type transport system involved in cytochrome bd biosynthesis fused ATPase/permease subunit
MNMLEFITGFGIGLMAFTVGIVLTSLGVYAIITVFKCL